ATEEPVERAGPRIPLRDSRRPELGALPVAAPLGAALGASHRPLGPGLGRGLGVRTRLVPFSPVHEVIRERDPRRGMVQPVVLRPERAFERLLPLLHVAARLKVCGQHLVSPEVVGHELDEPAEVPASIIEPLVLVGPPPERPEQPRRIGTFLLPPGNHPLHALWVLLDQYLPRVLRVR